MKNLKTFTSSEDPLCISKKVTSGIFKISLLFLFLFLSFGQVIGQTVFTEFELEGNPQETPGAPEDWATAYPNGGSSDLFKFIAEPTLTSNADNVFTTGSKDVNPINTWGWAISNAADKADLQNGAVALYGEYLYFAADRYAVNGTTNIGIWLFKNDISLNPNGTFNGTHAIGDLLILSEFVNGGGVSNIKAYEWVGSGGSHGSLNELVIPTSQIAAFTNDAVIPSVWPFQGKNFAANMYDLGAFFEGGLFLGDQTFEFDPCFASFIIETRSSASLDASLQDLILGQFATVPIVTVNNDEICAGEQASLTATVAPGTGVGPFTYSWQPGNLTGATITPSPVVTTSYTVIVTGDNGCEAPPQTGTVTVNATPAVPTVQGDARCGAGVVNLTASCSSGGSTPRWYAASSGGSPIATGTAYSPNIATTTTYYVSCYNATTGCESARVPVTGTVNAIPAVPTVQGDAICGPGVVNLTASCSSGGSSARWYTASSGGSPIATGGAYSPNIATTTTYYVSCYNATTGCESARVPVTGTVNAIPAVPTVQGDARCGAGVVNLTASCSSGGSTARWYTASSGGSPIATGSAYSPNIATTTTYYVSCYNATTGCESARVPVTGTVNAIPAVPTVQGDAICGPGVVNLTASCSSGGSSARWYTASSGGSPIATGSAYSPNIATTTTYYVSCYNATTGCESARVPVTGTVNAIPAVPTVQGDAVCGPGVVNLTASCSSGGSTARWYAAASGGSPIATGGAYSPNIATTTTFYVSCYNATTGCESARVPVVGTVNAIPAVPTVQGDERCGAGVVNLTASCSSGGSTPRWYAASSGGSPIATGGAYSPNIGSTTTFYVSCYNATTGCESARVPVTGTVNGAPAVPTVQGDAICGPGVVNLTASCSTGGSSARWYTASSGGSPIATGSAYSPNIATTTTYYVSCYNSTTGCESARVPVTGTVNAIPAVPTVQGDARCGAGVVNLTASCSSGGSTARWYTASSGGSPIATGSAYSPNIATTTTYYVSCYNATTGCESARVPVTGTVNAIPAVPTVQGDARCGAGVVNLTASCSSGGSSARWYTASSGGSPIATGSAYSPNIATTTTYYVSCYNATTGCESARVPVTGTVNAIPAVPSVQGDARCGAGVVNLTASCSSGGSTARWYTASSGGSPIATGSAYSPNIASTTTYYVSCYNATTGCESGRVPVTGTINLPTPLTGSQDEICEGELADISVNPGGLTSYSWTGSGTINSPSSASSTVSGLTAGNYTFTVTATNGNGCTSSTTSSVIVRPLPDLPNQEVTIVCNGDPVDVTSYLPAGYNIIGVAGSSGPVGDIVSEEDTYLVDYSNEYGCPGSFTIIVTVEVCDMFCSLTQGFYGNAGGVYCGTDQGTAALINDLLVDPLVLGGADRSLTFTDANELCVIMRLPGGGPAGKLMNAASHATLNGSCGFIYAPAVGNNQGILLTNQGKFRNSLLAQTLTLGLNLRLPYGPGPVVMTDSLLVTIKAADCNNAAAGPMLGAENDTFHIPMNVITWLQGNGGASVNNLYALANSALNGDALPAGVTYSDISAAVNAFNDGFDECALFVAFTHYEEVIVEPVIMLKKATTTATAQDLTIEVYPNPFNASTTIEFTVGASNQTTFEVYNVTGVKVATLYEGMAEAGHTYKVTFDAANLPSGTYFYRLQSGSDSHYDKMILIK